MSTWYTEAWIVKMFKRTFNNFITHIEMASLCLIFTGRCSAFLIKLMKLGSHRIMGLINEVWQYIRHKEKISCNLVISFLILNQRWVTGKLFIRFCQDIISVTLQNSVVPQNYYGHPDHLIYCILIDQFLLGEWVCNSILRHVINRDLYSHGFIVVICLTPKCKRTLYYREEYVLGS